jgi:hypothetical protein
MSVWILHTEERLLLCIWSSGAQSSGKHSTVTCSIGWHIVLAHLVVGHAAVGHKAVGHIALGHVALVYIALEGT